MLQRFGVVLAAVAMTLGGCNLFRAVEHGAAAEVRADGGPVAPPPAGDNSTAYAIGVAAAALGLAAVEKFTGGALSRHTIATLAGLVEQGTSSLGASVPVEVHAQIVQGLAQSQPINLPNSIAPAPRVISEV